MSTINMNNMNTFLQSLNGWQSSSSSNKSGNTNSSDEILSLFQKNKITDISNLDSVMQSLNDPAKVSAYTSRYLEYHAEYNLKAAFQTQDGTNMNLELNVKLDLKFEQVSAAYAKNNENSSDEFSAENTANRIGNFAMGFLSAFQSNHADQSSSDSMGGFFKLAKDAISKGFEQAKDILGDLYGETAEDTYDMVMKFLDDAKAKLLGDEKATDTVAGQTVTQK